MENIKKYLSEGKTFSEIARIVGRTPERIRQICRKNGWERKPFNYELPKVPSRLSVLRASGKDWCHSCKVQDVPFMISARRKGNPYHRCRPCNQARLSAYYKTEGGHGAMRKAANKSYHKLKILKN